MRPLPLLLSFSLMAIVSCGKVCTTVLVPGISLHLDPDLTDVIVTVTAALFTETVNVNPGAWVVDLVYERPGTYRIEVTAAGHAPWTVSNVRVEQDDCHVTTVSLTAELVPVGGSVTP